MSIEALAAIERTEKGYKVRKAGFVPAVIYGKTVPSKSIQLQANDVHRLIRTKGNTGIISLSLNGQVYTGVLKEVKTDPVRGDIQHLQIQVAAANEEVTIEVPFVPTGRSALENRKLLLQIDLPHIKVKGPLSDIPEKYTMDVSGLQAGDVILVKDLEKIPSVVIETPEDHVIASVLVLGTEDTVDTEDTKTEDTEAAE